MSNIDKTLSAKVDINRYSQIMFFVHIGRQTRMRIKSNIFVPIDYWNTKKECLVIPKRTSPKTVIELQGLKERLDVAEKRTIKLIEMYGNKADKKFIESTLNMLSEYSGTITKEVVENIFEEQAEKARQAKKKSVFDLIDDFFTSHKLSTGRIRYYKVIFRCMARYQLYCNAIYKNDFAWIIDDTTKEDIEDFYDYIANEHLFRTKMPHIFEDVDKIYPDGKDHQHKKPIISERGGNRIVGMKKGVHSFWNWLLKEGRTTNDPLRFVKIGEEFYGVPYFLTMAERDKVAKYDLSAYPHLEMQRDIFIFQCFVGCRVGDLMTLTKDNVETKDKMKVLVYMPHKTKDHQNTFVARVPLNDVVLSLINKYEGKDKNGRLFPFIASNNYNDAIKQVLKKCEIKRNVAIRNSKTGETEMKPLYEVASSHMARRTFIGIAYRIVQDPNLIGRMSGHTENSKAFARYRVTDDEMSLNVIEKMTGK